MDDLAKTLARQARQLGLDACNVAEAEAEQVQQFAAFVLAELAARGLVAGEKEIGCWARPRVGGN